MAPKRVTNYKQSANSKRHKTSKTTTSKSKSGPQSHKPAALLDEPAKPVRNTGSFPADLPSKESAKKDRKGKGPQFIPAVEQNSSDESGEDSDEGGMEVDEELEDMEQTGFLMKLDEKGMSV